MNSYCNLQNNKINQNPEYILYGDDLLITYSLEAFSVCCDTTENEFIFDQMNCQRGGFVTLSASTNNLNDSGAISSVSCSLN